jgi:hypothetical protein
MLTYAIMLDLPIAAHIQFLIMLIELKTVLSLEQNESYIFTALQIHKYTERKCMYTV